MLIVAKKKPGWLNIAKLSGPFDANHSEKRCLMLNNKGLYHPVSSDMWNKFQEVRKKI